MRVQDKNQAKLQIYFADALFISCASCPKIPLVRILCGTPYVQNTRPNGKIAPLEVYIHSKKGIKPGKIFSIP